MRNHELLIFVLGVFAASSTLQALTDIARKKWFLQVIFFFAVGTQISTQGIQFSNALLSRKELDRKSSLVLYAYTEKDMVLLNTISADEPYMAGYRYFRDRKDHPGNYDEARRKFEQSIGEGKYVAQSHYLIAHMIRERGGDLTDAKEHLTQAITYDDKYSAPYYARAILEVNAKEIKAAIDDLATSTNYGVAQCFDISNPEEVRTVWPAIASDPRFTALQAECKRRYPQILKDTFQPSSDGSKSCP
jgi:tetratricopeptide (TPR) repeat protein